ncbi:MAG: hypothetical protein JXQ68_01660 [Campylobacterales bacterium]|nr:hypothetical protein [Campylobacterales bacterium]
MLRVEYIVILLTVLTLFFSLSFDAEKSKKVAQVEKKDLEFDATIFREVDKNSTISSAFAMSGTRVKDTLRLKNIKFSNSDIKYLIGNNSTYKNNVITLNGDVKMLTVDGLYCETQSARYTKDDRVIYILKPFRGHMGENRLDGDTLRYFLNEKRILVENPRAIIITAN